MKTITIIHAQQTRISNLLYENTRNQIRSAHPETDGNFMLCNNWGNADARAYLFRMYEREIKLFHLFAMHFAKAFKAEYPNHVTSRE